MNIIILILSLFILVSCNYSNSDKNQKTQRDKFQKNSMFELNNESLIKFQGKWESEKDSNYFIQIKNDTLVEIYDGDIIMKTKINILNNCDGIQVDSNIEEREFIAYYFEDDKKFECIHEILSDGKSVLTLMNLENGRINIFRKD